MEKRKVTNSKQTSDYVAFAIKWDEGPDSLPQSVLLKSVPSQLVDTGELQLVDILTDEFDYCITDSTMVSSEDFDGDLDAIVDYAES